MPPCCRFPRNGHQHSRSADSLAVSSRARVVGRQDQTCRSVRPWRFPYLCVKSARNDLCHGKVTHVNCRHGKKLRKSAGSMFRAWQFVCSVQVRCRGCIARTGAATPVHVFHPVSPGSVVEGTPICAASALFHRGTEVWQGGSHRYDDRLKLSTGFLRQWKHSSFRVPAALGVDKACSTL